jgi:hypothetical protein
MTLECRHWYEAHKTFRKIQMFQNLKQTTRESGDLVSQVSFVLLQKGAG